MPVYYLHSTTSGCCSIWLPSEMYGHSGLIHLEFAATVVCVLVTQLNLFHLCTSVCLLLSGCSSLVISVFTVHAVPNENVYPSFVCICESVVLKVCIDFQPVRTAKIFIVSSGELS